MNAVGYPWSSISHRLTKYGVTGSAVWAFTNASPIALRWVFTWRRSVVILPFLWWITIPNPVPCVAFVVSIVVFFWCFFYFSTTKVQKSIDISKYFVLICINISLIYVNTCLLFFFGLLLMGDVRLRCWLMLVLCATCVPCVVIVLSCFGGLLQ